MLRYVPKDAVSIGEVIHVTPVLEVELEDGVEVMDDDNTFVDLLHQVIYSATQLYDQNTYHTLVQFPIRPDGPFEQHFASRAIDDEQGSCSTNQR